MANEYKIVYADKDTGGWIDWEPNLEPPVTCRVDDDVKAPDDTRVSGGTLLSGGARVYEDAWLPANIRVYRYVKATK